MAKDLEMGYLLDFYGEVLTQKQREMLRQYYNDDLSLSEIGENFGITRQGARDAIKHGENALKELGPRRKGRLGSPLPAGAAEAGTAGTAGHRHPVRVHWPPRQYHHHGICGNADKNAGAHPIDG